MRRIEVLCAALFLFFVFTSEGRATTAIRLTPEEQVASADAIALGRCTQIESRVIDDQIRTYVTFEVREVLKGPISEGRLVVKQVGGKVGDSAQWVEGSPRFSVGRDFVVFLAPNGEGAYVVDGLFMGCFSVGADPTGRVWLARDAGDGVLILPRSDVAADRLVDEIALDELRRVVALDAARAAKSEDPVAAAQVPVEYTGTFGGPREYTSDFVLFNNTRWFEPDSGQRVQFWCNTENFQPGGTNVPSLPEAMADALASWSSVPGSSFRAEFMGVESAGCGWRRDGVSRVSVDCANQVTGTSCQSIIAIGGACSIDGSQRVTVNGTSFSRTLEADITLNDGFCDLFQNPNYLRYILAHEFGHCIGFNHTPVREATMSGSFSYSNATRGAALHTDDQDGARFVYPGTSEPDPEPEPPIIVTETISGATLGVSFTQPLAVDKGEAPFAWAVSEGSLPPGLGLSAEGVVSGTPSATGFYAFTVRVTDARQQTTSKPFTMQVRVPPPVVLAAEYRKGKKTLTIVGQNFVAGASVTLNGVLTDASRITVRGNEILATGTRKKLALRKGVGANEVIVAVEGVPSQVYRF